MFISIAHAQDAAGGAAAADGGNLLLQFLPFILIFVVFYFLLIRPQQQKAKQHREMVASLRRHDRIITAGGIVGTVTKTIDDEAVMVEIAEGVRVRIERAYVTRLLSRTDAGGSDSAGSGSGTTSSGQDNAKQGGGLLGGFLGKKDKG